MNVKLGFSGSAVNRNAPIAVIQEVPVVNVATVVGAAKIKNVRAKTIGTVNFAPIPVDAKEQYCKSAEYVAQDCMLPTMAVQCALCVPSENLERRVAVCTILWLQPVIRIPACANCVQQATTQLPVVWPYANRVLPGNSVGLMAVLPAPTVMRARQVSTFLYGRTNEIVPRVQWEPSLLSMSKKVVFPVVLESIRTKRRKLFVNNAQPVNTTRTRSTQSNSMHRTPK